MCVRIPTSLLIMFWLFLGAAAPTLCNVAVSEWEVPVHDATFGLMPTVCVLMALFNVVRACIRHEELCKDVKQSGLTYRSLWE